MAVVQIVAAVERDVITMQRAKGIEIGAAIAGAERADIRRARPPKIIETDLDESRLVVNTEILHVLAASVRQDRPGAELQPFGVHMQLHFVTAILNGRNETRQVVASEGCCRQRLDKKYRS